MTAKGCDVGADFLRNAARGLASSWTPMAARSSGFELYIVDIDGIVAPPQLISYSKVLGRTVVKGGVTQDFFYKQYDQ